ncbi:unnamed protein product [Bursaphelenchus xylophilus]|uniref:(pine wood nematode) hypothetical protein n=1 Tax=Bursaphelenchus xylophilus TaxID=6326 RepID=A0A1I7RK85_BURXY|nr:cytochrome P450-33C4 [Bursaphelenchus xylophilus]CAD5235199.1 unnamed protein product [Bursaphelenchus xylophilus]CAG9131422.1 unnamed protein product [Bursaphelenchus xylophilus]
MWEVIFIAFFVAFWTYHLWWKRRNLPPGPPPWPFFGNYFQFKRYSAAEYAYLDWRKKYGDIFTFWQGERPVVCVCSYDLMVEHFQKQGEKYEDRPPEGVFWQYVKRYHYGIVNNDGDLWRVTRRFALQTLRDFGLGKDLMEQRVLAECEDILRNLDEEEQKGIKEHPITVEIDRAIGSVVNSLIFGYRYSKENIHEWDDLKERANNFLRLVVHPVVLFARLHPTFYEKVPILGKYLKSVKQSGTHLMDFFVNRVDYHMKDLENEDLESLEPTDLVAAFLKERARLDSLNEQHLFSREQLNGMCFDVWLAGQDTTSNTIGWAIAYLIKHQEIQQKIHEELDREIGSERMVTISDRPNLNYLQAVCLETHRIANLVPSNIFHATAEDVNFEGYFLKKATTIIPLCSVVLYDEKIFPQPEEFIPERFIDKNGNVRTKKELLAFSIGKRQCLGENLARMEVFLVLANILNQYKILPTDVPLDFTRRHALTSYITDYKCRLVPRYK